MTRPKREELPIFSAWMQFLEWLLPTTEKFPKRARFTLANRIDNLALDVIEDLVEARYTRDKLERLGSSCMISEQIVVQPHRRRDGKVDALRRWGDCQAGAHARPGRADPPASMLGAVTAASIPRAVVPRATRLVFVARIIAHQPARQIAPRR